MTQTTPSVPRHLTAMHRTSLSRPLVTAQSDGLLAAGTSVFDFGCGRGSDVRHLRRTGIDARGWDPAFAPEEPKTKADVVNLGYVINVIEDPEERVSVLREAWALARGVLVVAARLEWDARRLNGRPHQDGLVTVKGTFQKLYRQEELGIWIEHSLGRRPTAAAPGIFYVFRDEEVEQRFLAGRVRRRLVAPQPLVSEKLFEANRDLFDDLAAFIASRGRLPRDDEPPNGPELRAAIGSAGRAFAILRRITGAGRWAEISEARRTDLLVYLALGRFGGRPPFARLPREIQYDVRDLLGSYRAATEEADRLLFRAGDVKALDGAMRSSPVGKLTAEALYIHVSVLDRIDPLLRVYEGCARALTGNVEGATILKLHRLKPQVSYLEYPTFDREAHPQLATVIVARLRSLDVSFKDFRNSSNPPVLHRKETFVPAEYAGRDRFARLTAQEEAWGLLSNERIGTKLGWEEALTRAGAVVQGHQLRRVYGSQAHDQ